MPRGNSGASPSLFSARGTPPGQTSSPLHFEIAPSRRIDFFSLSFACIQIANAEFPPQKSPEIASNLTTGVGFLDVSADVSGLDTLMNRAQLRVLTSSRIPRSRRFLFGSGSMDVDRV